MQEIGVEAARLKLGEIVDRARLADQPTTLTRYGQPAAVVVSYEWYSEAKRMLTGKREETAQ
jgi:prevent-host-death family protein